MNIGLLNPTILMRRPIAELAVSLQTRGHQVTIITPVNKGVGWTPSHYEGHIIPTISLPCWEVRQFLWSWPSWSAVTRLWNVVHEFEVIQIWAPYYLVAILPIIFSRLRPKTAKIILTFDTIPGFSFRFESVLDPLMILYHRLVGSWLFRLAKARTLYSQLLLPFARRAWLGQSFSVIPTGITLPAVTEPRHQLTEKIELLFIGILNDRKGVGVLLQAAHWLQQNNIPFHLNIVGDGPGRQMFEQQRQDLQLTESVDFVGRTTDVSTYFQQADVFILPSFGEGLPGVVMEAMAYGIPVVASNIPCLPDLLPNDQVGQLFAVGSVTALVQAILHYRDNQEYRQSVATAARKKIENLTWDLVTPHYEELYARTI